MNKIFNLTGLRSGVLVIFVLFLSCSSHQTERNNDEKRLILSKDISVPRPVGELKKIYPETARAMGVEAEVDLFLSVDKNGNVLKVAVKEVKLSRKLYGKQKTKIKTEFKEAVVEILSEQKFTPAVVSGEKVNVRYETSFKFKLK